MSGLKVLQMTVYILAINVFNFIHYHYLKCIKCTKILPSVDALHIYDT